MKIVHVCLCGPMTDGWNYQENLLTAQHKKMGLDVSVIASQWIWGSKGHKEKYRKTNYINEDGVKVIRLPLAFGTVDTRLKLYRNFFRTLEAESPDILFIHDVQFLNVMTIVRFLKKNQWKQIKVYADNHVDFSNGASNWLSKNVLHKVLWRFIVKQLEPFVTKFYGVLPARVEFLKELYHLPEEKCELLVMGADETLVKEAAEKDSIQLIRKSYQIEKDDFLIVTGGKIDEHKTQTLALMEAVKNISDDKTKLIVFGSVSEELREKVKLLCDGRKVRYIGWVQAKDSYKYFAAADLVVFPGRHSVFWEQVAAQGIPMLCKEWSGTKHVDLGGNVYFLQDSSKVEIEERLNYIQTHPEEYLKMRMVAENGKQAFSYTEIARKAIDWREKC